MSSVGGRLEHFSSSPFSNAGFPDGILKYAFRAKSAGGFEVKNGTKHTDIHTYMQGAYESVSRNVYSADHLKRRSVNLNL